MARFENLFADSLWYTINGALCIAALLLPAVSESFKLGLASLVLTEGLSGIIVWLISTKFLSDGSAFEASLGLLVFFGFTYVVFVLYGENKYAIWAILPILRSGYIGWRYWRRAEDDLGLQREFFVTCARGLIPFLYFVGYLLITDRHMVISKECALESDLICRVLNPPDLFLIFGMFYFPIIAVIVVKWRPSWLLFFKGGRRTE